MLYGTAHTRCDPLTGFALVRQQAVSLTVQKADLDGWTRADC
jgi:hypothetical protein